MILVDRDIRFLLETGAIRLDPFEHANLQPASYDLTLYSAIRRVDPKIEILDPRSNQDYTISQVPATSFILHPHEFILASSRERIVLADNIVGQVAGKSSLARMGVQVESAGYFDPGWDGQATFELVNLTQRPVRLYPGMKIAQIVFTRASGSAERPYGSDGLGSKYQGQQGPTPSAMWREDLVANEGLIGNRHTPRSE